MAETQRTEEYEYPINDREAVYFRVNEEGIISNETGEFGCEFVLRRDGKPVEISSEAEVDELTEKLISSVIRRLNFQSEEENATDIHDEIYQMFGVDTTYIFPIMALNFSAKKMKDSIRFFEILPSKKQLENLSGYCNREKRLVVFPLVFENHFATGICKDGSFYIFDSTRQVTKGKNTKINDVSFSVLNSNKKFQSELTGTCGFWTMYFCLEFAYSKEQGFSDVVSLKGKSPEIQGEALARIGNKVYSVTASILYRNKDKIRSIDNKFDFKNLLADVEETAKGIQPSQEFSKSMSTFKKRNSKKGKKRLGYVTDTQVSDEQIPEETNSVPSQPLVPGQLQGDTIQLSKDARDEIEALKSKKQVIKRQRSNTI